MFFKDIIGQDDVKRRLIESVKNGHIAHAQLFEGNDGAGALPLALAYARYIQCTHRGEDDACGECPSCRQMTALMHPDVHFVFPIANKKQKKEPVCDDYIAEWRNYVGETPYPSAESWQQFLATGNSQPLIYVHEAREIIRKLSLKSFESEYKIMIIWLPELMNPVCANKLLKILEEPYEKTVFLLVSNQPDKILGTILSRSQRINMRVVSPEKISEALQRRYSLGQQDADAVAHIANGNFIKALETIQLSEENQYFFDLFVRLMRLKVWSEEAADMGREKEKRFLAYTQRMLRENYIYNLHIPEISYLNSREEQFSTRFAPFIHERNIISLMNELSKAESDISQNANGKIVFFDLAIKMIMLLKS